MYEITQRVQVRAAARSGRLPSKGATRWFLLLLLSLISVSAAAREIAGIKMPDLVTLDGTQCRLNGLGVRTKTLLKIKVYVAGLYLETPSDNAEQVIAIDGARQLTLRMTHNASKDRVQSELMDGFERNSKALLPTLKGRIEKFFEGVPELKKGQGLSITYLPGKGTTVKATGTPEVTVLGKDFADALFSAWLGKNPLDDELKKQLLGAPQH